MLFARHRLFTGVLALGVLVRVCVMLGYQPARLYYGDSYAYLATAESMKPMWGFQPSGYPMLLWLLQPAHSLVIVAVVQHLMGLSVGVMVYSLLRERFRLPEWGASLAAVPLLFDAYLIGVEHSILADELFVFLMAAGVTAALWRPVPTARLAVVAGVCFALAALTRTVGLPMLPVFLGWLAVRRVGWRTLAATVAVSGLMLVSYASWYDHENGKFELSDGAGLTLWARTMNFADCKVIKPPTDEKALCPNGDYNAATSDYVWDPKSPLNRAGWATGQKVGTSFALRAVRAQPWDYVKAVVQDTSLAFHWDLVPHPARATDAYRFGTGRWPLDRHPGSAATVRAYDPDVRGFGATEPWAGMIRSYQSQVFLRGPVLAALLVVGGLGLAVSRRALLPYALAWLLLVVPIAVLDFDHRYVLPVLPFACIAAALALADLVPGIRAMMQDRSGYRGPHAEEGAGHEVRDPAAGGRVAAGADGSR